MDLRGKLRSGGIAPSNETTHKLSETQATLKAQAGTLLISDAARMALFFNKFGTSTTLAAWYVASRLYAHINVYAQERFGRFKAVDTTTTPTCSTAAGIHYFQRTPTSERVVAF